MIADGAAEIRSASRLRNSVKRIGKLLSTAVQTCWNLAIPRALAGLPVFFSLSLDSDCRLPEFRPQSPKQNFRAASRIGCGCLHAWRYWPRLGDSLAWLNRAELAQFRIVSTKPACG